MSATARRGVLFGLVLAVVVTFWPAAGHQFVFDDFQYVVTNPDVQKGFSPETVRWAFTSRYASNWHPVTWLSHMLDVQLFGLETVGPHLVNILLHAVNAVLLFLVLSRLTSAPWRSALVAGLFAVHPLHVETVAWVAERKDLLATLFLLLALAAYRRYAEQPGTARYLAVAALFCLGIMAKPMVITLPVLLLLLDFWPLDRRSRGIPLHRLLLEKLPLVAISALSAAMTIVAQREGGAMRSVHQYPLSARAGNALVSYLAYIAKTLNPSGLTAFYPHPGPDLPLWKAAGAGLLLAIFTWAAVRHMRSRPWLTAGWLWYLLTLVPVIGLVQVGDQGLADRYTYLPLIGLFIITSWGAEDLTIGRQRLRQFVPAAAASVLILLAGASRVQVAWWKDNDTLFRRALAVTTNNWFAHISLGAVLGMQGDLEGGAAQYREALRIRPQDPMLQNNLGFILGRQGRIEEALARFREAALLKEDYAEPLFNAGVLYLKINDLDRASRQCEALDRVDRRWADRLREFLRYKQGLISVKPEL
jgi:tetratricopeptide (TPR) repeat protein